MRWFTVLVIALFVTTTAFAANHAWMYGNQPTASVYTPNPAHSYNPAPNGAIQVERFDFGVYRVTFKNLKNITGPNANVQVTAAGNGTANCHVMDWVGSLPNDFITHVRCYKTNNGNKTDTEFTLLVTYP